MIFFQSVRQESMLFI